MCHPSDKEYMSVDKTWGIMPPSDICPSVLGFYMFTLFGIAMVWNQLRLPVNTTSKFTSISLSPNNLTSFFFFFYKFYNFNPSIYMEKWRRVEGEPILSNRQLL